MGLIVAVCIAIICIAMTVLLVVTVVREVLPRREHTSRTIMRGRADD